LSSNVRKNGIPFKGKVYMNKRSILNNLFKRHKFKPDETFLENVTSIWEDVVSVEHRQHKRDLAQLKGGNAKSLTRYYEKMMIWLLRKVT
jgi:hypothetical protein